MATWCQGHTEGPRLTQKSRLSWARERQTNGDGSHSYREEAGAAQSQRVNHGAFVFTSIMWFSTRHRGTREVSRRSALWDKTSNQNSFRLGSFPNRRKGAGNEILMSLQIFPTTHILIERHFWRKAQLLPSAWVATLRGAELSPGPCLLWATTRKAYLVSGFRFWMVTCISPGRLVFTILSLRWEGAQGRTRNELTADSPPWIKRFSHPWNTYSSTANLARMGIKTSIYRATPYYLKLDKIYVLL